RNAQQLTERADELRDTLRAAQTGEAVDLPQTPSEPISGPTARQTPPEGPVSPGAPQTRATDLGGPGFTTVKRGNRERIVRQSPNGDTRPPNDSEFAGVYQRLRDMSEDEF